MITAIFVFIFFLLYKYHQLTARNELYTSVLFRIFVNQTNQ